MDLAYLLAPFASWFVAGSCKFLINSLRARSFAFGQIGYGGLPSNHSAIVSSAVALVAMREGISHPAFGVAITLAFIVLLDASSLRKQVGHQAKAINALAKSDASPLLRERMGHTPVEILAGIIVGISVAAAIQAVFGA